MNDDISASGLISLFPFARIAFLNSIETAKNQNSRKKKEGNQEISLIKTDSLNLLTRGLI